jgi:hypothetical protein
MKDHTRLYSDILFYTKELDRIDKELNEARKAITSGNALLRLEREREKVKSRLDALCTEIPEATE